MCDYSLQAFKSRPAKVGEKLVTHRFHSGSGGFVSPEDGNDTAICVLPGTELAFDSEQMLTFVNMAYYGSPVKIEGGPTARFRQIHLDVPFQHHDALEFSDGQVIELHRLSSGLTATVLQLPAAPKTDEEAKAQERLPVVA